MNQRTSQTSWLTVPRKIQLTEICMWPSGEGEFSWHILGPHGIKMGLGRKVPDGWGHCQHPGFSLSVCHHLDHFVRSFLLSLEYSGCLTLALLVGQIPALFHITLFAEVLSCDSTMELDMFICYLFLRPDLSLKSTVQLYSRLVACTSAGVLAT